MSSCQSPPPDAQKWLDELGAAAEEEGKIAREMAIYFEAVADGMPREEALQKALSESPADMHEKIVRAINEVNELLSES